MKYTSLSTSNHKTYLILNRTVNKSSLVRVFRENYPEEIFSFEFSLFYSSILVYEGHLNRQSKLPIMVHLQK